MAFMHKDRFKTSSLLTEYVIKLRAKMYNNVMLNSWKTKKKGKCFLYSRSNVHYFKNTTKTQVLKTQGLLSLFLFVFVTYFCFCGIVSISAFFLSSYKSQIVVQFCRDFLFTFKTDYARDKSCLICFFSLREK